MSDWLTAIEARETSFGRPPMGRRGYHEDEVDAVLYDGADEAVPATGVVEAIGAADALVFAPSNPYVSLGPILAVVAIHDAIAARRVPCVAVSPLIGGRAVPMPNVRLGVERLAGA